MGKLIEQEMVINEIEERKYANRTNTAVVSELNRLEGYIMLLSPIEPKMSIKRSAVYSKEIIKAFYDCNGCERCDLAVDGEISELCLLLEQFKNDILERIRRVIDNEERK